MRILVIRSGSGWGGIYGCCIFDTKNKVCIDIQKCYNITKDPIYYHYDNTEGIINLSLSKFPKKAIMPFTLDISLLEFFLPNCELEYRDECLFDQQIDHVYISKSNKQIECVLDTDEGFWPKNPALNAKLRKLIELVN